jgi:hypothetical protein
LLFLTCKVEQLPLSNFQVGAQRPTGAYNRSHNEAGVMPI